MQKTSLISIMLIAVLLSTTFLPVVSAEDYTGSSISVSLEPGASDQTSTTVNTADETNITKEMDAIYNYLPSGTEGKYYGPYLQSSLFQFSTTGGYFQFATNFTIGSDIIMNGVSNMYVRIPIVPAQYDWYHVVITWDNRFNAIETGPDAWVSGITDTNIWKMVTPYELGDFDYAHGPPGYEIGNYWSFDGTNNSVLIPTDYGLFLNLNGQFLSGVQFTIAFTGHLAESNAPQVFLTQELWEDTNYSYRFFDFKTLGNTAKFTYDYSTNFALAPAFAFVFLNGIGKYGMTSYTMEFDDSDGEDDSLQFYGAWMEDFNTTNGQVSVEGFTNGSYFSFYMPFQSLYNFDTPGSAEIDWEITVYLTYDWDFAEGGQYFMINGSKRDSQTFYVNDTSNYLLFTCPNKIWTDAFVIDESIAICLVLNPVQNCSLKLLGNVVDDDYERLEQCNYYHEYYYQGMVSLNNNELYPLFNSYSFTNTIWAQVTETSLYDIYDFGWGKGYNFPGETNIYIFLDDGGQYLYNGSYAGFVENWNNRDSEDSFITMIMNALRNAVGWIWDGITWVWDTLVGIGTWIYNVISEFIDIIVTIAKDVISKVVSLVQGFIYGLPIIITLFVVNYAGQMFQTGHMPRARKERRKLKQLKSSVKRSITKPLFKRMKKDGMTQGQVDKTYERSARSYGRASATGYKREVKEWNRQRSAQTRGDRNQQSVSEHALASTASAKTVTKDTEVVKAEEKKEAKQEPINETAKEQKSETKKLAVVAQEKEPSYLDSLTADRPKATKIQSSVKGKTESRKQFEAWRTSTNDDEQGRMDNYRWKLEQARRNRGGMVDMTEAEPMERPKHKPISTDIKPKEYGAEPAKAKVEPIIVPHTETPLLPEVSSTTEEEQKAKRREQYAEKVAKQKEAETLQKEIKFKEITQKKEDQEQTQWLAKENKAVSEANLRVGQMKQKEQIEQDRINREKQQADRKEDEQLKKDTEAENKAILKANKKLEQLEAEERNRRDEAIILEHQKDKDALALKVQKEKEAREVKQETEKTEAEKDAEMDEVRKIEMTTHKVRSMESIEQYHKARNDPEYIKAEEERNKANDIIIKTKSAKKKAEAEKRYDEAEAKKEQIEKDYQIKPEDTKYYGFPDQKRIDMEQAKAEGIKKAEQPPAPLPKEERDTELEAYDKARKKANDGTATNADLKLIDDYRAKHHEKGYSAVNETQARANQKKLMAEFEKEKADSADAKYLRSNGISETFIKNANESELSKMAGIVRKQKKNPPKTPTEKKIDKDNKQMAKLKKKNAEKPKAETAKQKTVTPKQSINERHSSATSNIEWIDQQKKDKAPRSDYNGELESVKDDYANMNRNDKKEFKEYVKANHPDAYTTVFKSKVKEEKE